MDRVLYSIEETRGASRRHLPQQPLPILRARSLPSVVIGCRRFVSAEVIATLVSSYTTSVSPSQDAARSRRPRWLMHARTFVRVRESASDLMSPTPSK